MVRDKGILSSGTQFAARTFMVCPVQANSSKHNHANPTSFRSIDVIFGVDATRDRHSSVIIQVEMELAVSQSKLE